MRIIITALLLVISIGVSAQRIVPIGGVRTTDTGLISGSFKVDSVLVFPAYRTTDENMVLGFDSRGKAVLRINNDSLLYATRRYVDSTANAITAGSVDSSIYSTVTRLADSLYRLRLYTDSLYTVMATKQGSDSLLLALRIDTANFQIAEAFIEIDNIQNEFVNVYDSIFLVDSALGVAFGAISALYDTLPNYVPYIGATGNVDIGTHTFTAKDGVFNHSSGSGTTLSVTKGGAGEALTVNKTSGSGNAMSVTGGVTLLDELHTTTPIADAYIASAATWNAKGTVSSVATGYGLSGGTITTTGTLIADSTLLATKLLVKKQIDSVAALSGGGGGGSPTLATPYELLYQSGTDTIKSTPKVYVDTTDNRLVLAYDSTNSTVVADPNGGVKVWGSTRMGMSSIRILDTVSIPAALQRAINMQTASLMFPVISGSILYSNNYLYSGMVQTVGTFSYVVAGYNSTMQHLNYNKTLITTASGANSNGLIRIASIAQSAGLICGNTKFSGGGGRGTFTCSFPTYLSTERIMIGYVGKALGALNNDPSAFILGNSAPALLITKDASETELQFLHFNGSGVAVSKVSTGITPNNEDMYRITIYIAPNSTYYMQLEVLSKTGTQTVTFHPETNVPEVEDRMVTYQAVNNGTVGGVVSYGLIQHIEEVY